MDNSIIGYAAATTSVVAFGTQFVHTIRSGTMVGLSLPRTVLDSVSLLLWVVYATRIEDHPLLIATSFEFLTSLCICVIIVRNRYQGCFFVKVNTPDATPVASPAESVVIDISPDSSVRRDSNISVRHVERRHSI
jgi:uncharacterized protein with PQ loop repeat